MNSKPFFSIVIPTRNRADFLSYAVQSVLNQSFDDFELVVSDNYSTDNTEQAVKGFLDARIRYFKTEKYMPMGDSWEFALKKARGEYITFLGDDDAHSQIYLESLRTVIADHQADVIVCKMADYHYDCNEKQGSTIKAKSLVTTPFTNKLSVYDSKKAIRDLFVTVGLCKGKVSDQIQILNLINTVFHNSVFSKIRSEIGRVFPTIMSGDYYLTVIVLSLVKNYFYLDSPLSFHGISNVTTTSSISSRETGSTLKETQPELAVFKKVPCSLYVPYNFSADALLLAKSDLGGKLDYLDSDLTGYFVNINQHLTSMEFEGHDVEKERMEFEAALSKQENNVQRQVSARIFTKKETLKNFVLRTFSNPPIYKTLRRLRDRDKGANLIFKAEVCMFRDIFECSKFVNEEFLKEYGMSKS